MTELFKTLIQNALIKSSADGSMATYCVYLHYALKESIEKNIDAKSFDSFLKSFSFESIDFNDILDKFNDDNEFMSFSTKILRNIPIVKNGEDDVMIDEEKMQINIQKLFGYFESEGVLFPCYFIASNADWFLKLQYYYPVKDIHREGYILRKPIICRNIEPSYPKENENSVLNGLTDQEVDQMIYNLNESSKMSYTCEILSTNGLVENKGIIELTDFDKDFLFMEKINISTSKKTIQFNSQEQMNSVLKKINERIDSRKNKINEG